MSEIDALLQENRSFPPSDSFRRQSQFSDPEIYERAAQDPDAFWSALAGELEWIDAVAHGARRRTSLTLAGSSAAS